MAAEGRHPSVDGVGHQPESSMNFDFGLRSPGQGVELSEAAHEGYSIQIPTRMMVDKVAELQRGGCIIIMEDGRPLKPSFISSCPSPRLGMRISLTEGPLATSADAAKVRNA